jgi:hypothetical protein
LRYLVLLLVLLAGSASAQIHELKEFEKIADQLGPYPHDLYHYCEEAYDDSVSTTVPDGWYWTLVTDGYGSLEKYSVNVENNAINELRWEYPHQDTLVLDSVWDLKNGIYSYDNGNYFFVICRKILRPTVKANK